MKFPSPLTTGQIAQWTQSEIIGSKTAMVTGLNEIHNVEEGDITFVDHEKYYDFTLRSKATFIIINKKVEAPAGKTLLFNTNPFEAYNLLARKFKPEAPSYSGIADSAVIGKDTFISPNVVVGEKVRIGNNCFIYPNVTIYPYTEIGDNVIIHANTTIGADAFYYKRTPDGYLKMHSAGNTIIADKVEIGAGCTIDAGVSSSTYIGEGTKIDDQVHIGHDVKVGKHCIIAGQVGIAGNTKIGNWVTLFGKAAITKNIEIGDRAIIGANSGVAKSLEGGKTYFGSPAQEVHLVAKQNAIIKMLPGLWDKLRKL